jgi:RNA polymerase sigma-70 factor, ECF subfamily
MTERDSLLFNKIKDDDRFALNTLFATYYQKLCTFAFTYLHDRQEAEEIVSDVFVNLWKARHRLSIEKDIQSYLYISVKHACFESLNKQHPELESDSDVIDLLDVIDTSISVNELEYQELRHELEHAVSLLPARCQQIFIMSRFDGLKYREISAILGISEKTVENQLVKALHVVRTAMRKFQRDNDHPPLVKIS